MLIGRKDLRPIQKMMFIPTIVEDEAYFNVQIESNSYRVLSQIGYDDKTNHIYYLAVYLDNPPAWGYELRYCIEEYDDNGAELYSYWDRREVCKFIGTEDRKKVLVLLLALVRHLANLANPATVVMSVEDNGRGAPSKDVLIANVFETCGYTVQKFDPYYGKRVFRMERSEGSSS